MSLYSPNISPFGPVRSASLGDLTLSRSYDQRYQVSRIQAGSCKFQTIPARDSI